MSLRRVGLSNSLSTQAKIINKKITLSRVSLRRFPFPTAAAAAVVNYVEDVFSTYLYTGTGAAQSINNGIGLGNSALNNSSVSLNASNPSYLTFSSQVNLTGDFCIQAWVYPTSLTGTRLLFSSTTDNNVQLPRIQENGGIYCYVNGTTITTGSAASALAANVWTHLAMTRSGTTFRVFVNGVLYDTATYSGTFNVGVLGAFFFGGSLFSTNYAFGGNISNAQIVSGSAIYTTDFTPPQNTLTGGAVLLGAGATPLADTSGTGKTVTQFGSPAASSSGPWSVGGNNGGMVWFKNRNGTFDHAVFDTARGATKSLRPNDTVSEATEPDGLTAFNSNGFSMGSWSRVNTNTSTYASWTFRKQAKFFDVVTYTGNGAASRNINHNLGSTPGCIICKATSISDNWGVYHRSTGANGLYLNATNSAGVTLVPTGHTSTTFEVANGYGINNANGVTYVAYLFAHDAGGFGATGSDNVISCGSFTDNGAIQSINLGYEPQWVLAKRTNITGDWWLVDNMRGMPVVSVDATLKPNAADAEQNVYEFINPEATGFRWQSGSISSSGQTWIYIAIRRGPMKTPTSGTSVFTPVAVSSATSTGTQISNSFVVDAAIATWRNGTTERGVNDRLRGISTTNPTGSGNPILRTNTTGTETTPSNVIYQGDGKTAMLGRYFAGQGYNQIYWLWGRAPGFFDVVCYTGTGTDRELNHNLAVVPELIIAKSRSTVWDWRVISNFGTTNYDYGFLNLTNSFGNISYASDVILYAKPDASKIYLGPNAYSNYSGDTYVAYLFATCPGVSKVGSYSGTGTTLQVNCGFTSGARFVLIKRTDSTGDWYVWDSARGIIAGDDPYLLMNSTAAEVTNTDYIDPYSPGFEISSTAPAAINASGGTYIFLAIA